MSTSPAQRPDKRDIFEDPAIAEASADDPFAQFVLANWKSFAVVLAAVVLGTLAYKQFQATALEKRAAATQLFNEIHERYDAVVLKQQELEGAKTEAEQAEKAASTAKAGAEKDEATKKAAAATEKVQTVTKEVEELRQKTRLMITSLDSPKPFDVLSKMYGGLLAARFGGYDEVRSALNSTSWELVGSDGSAERFAAEMSALGLAKALAGSDQDRAVAKQALISLAERGQFAAVQAVVSLAYLASTPEDQQQVQGLISQVQKRFPTQQKYLDEAKELIGS